MKIYYIVSANTSRIIPLADGALNILNYKKITRNLHAIES